MSFLLGSDHYCTILFFGKMFVFAIVLYVLDLYFFSSFTLAKKRRKEVPRKEENQAGFRTLRVRYATL